MGLTLAELIKTIKGTDTYDDLVRRSGGKPGKKRWEQYAAPDGLKVFPDPESIEAIARGLGVNVETVLDACAESLGLHVTRSRSTLETLLPRGVEKLDDSTVAAFLALLRKQIEATEAMRANSD